MLRKMACIFSRGRGSGSAKKYRPFFALSRSSLRSLPREGSKWPVFFYQNLFQNAEIILENPKNYIRKFKKLFRKFKNGPRKSKKYSQKSKNCPRKSKNYYQKSKNGPRKSKFFPKIQKLFRKSKNGPRKS